MAKMGVGLDIGSTGVRMAVVRAAKGRNSLSGFGHVAIDGEAGFAEGVDPEALERAVSALAKELGPPKAPVNVGVSGQGVVARQVDLPWVPANELRKALPMLASDLLPMPVENSVLDFLVAEEIVETDGTRSLRGLLVAANELAINETVEAVQAGGLAVERVDFSPLSALRAVCDPRVVEAEAVIDVGANSTCMVVHEGRNPTFVRVLSRGGADATRDLAEELGISEEEAERWKTTVASLWPRMSPDEQHRTKTLLDQASSQLIEEIRSSITFHRTNTGARVSRAYLVGGGAVQFGLTHQLHAALNVDIRLGQPLQRLAAVDAKGLRTRADFSEPVAATAVGLALGVAA